MKTLNENGSKTPDIKTLSGLSGKNIFKKIASIDVTAFKKCERELRPPLEILLRQIKIILIIVSS